MLKLPCVALRFNPKVELYQAQTPKSHCPSLNKTKATESKKLPLDHTHTWKKGGSLSLFQTRIRGSDVAVNGCIFLQCSPAYYFDTLVYELSPNVFVEWHVKCMLLCLCQFCRTVVAFYKQ
jgi:hypothetical protein